MQNRRFIKIATSDIIKYYFIFLIQACRYNLRL